MYVPVLTVGEGQALIDYWHGLWVFLWTINLNNFITIYFLFRDYYGKKLEVFFSTDYGRQLEQ
jgi:hypothetical protein